jgi:hypothetical protein
LALRDTPYATIAPLAKKSASAAASFGVRTNEKAGETKKYHATAY